MTTKPKERATSIPGEFWGMAADVASRMRWSEPEAFGALLGIVRKGIIFVRAVATHLQLAYWAGVDRNVGEFTEAIVAAGFAEAEGELYRVPIVDAHFGRRNKMAELGASGGKVSQQRRRERDQADPLAPGQPNAEAYGQAHAPPYARAHGQAHAPPYGQAHAQADAQAHGQAHALAHGQANASTEGEALSERAGRAHVKTLSQPQFSQDNSELPSSSPAPVLASLDDCHETSLRAREAVTVRSLLEQVAAKHLTLKLARDMASAAATTVRKKLLVSGLPSTGDLGALLTPDALALVNTLYDGGPAELRRVFLAYRVHAIEQAGEQGVKVTNEMIAQAFEGLLHARFKHALQLEVRRRKGQAPPGAEGDNDLYAPPGTEAMFDH